MKNSKPSQKELSSSNWAVVSFSDSNFEEDYTVDWCDENTSYVGSWYTMVESGLTFVEASQYCDEIREARF